MSILSDVFGLASRRLDDTVAAEGPGGSLPPATSPRGGGGGGTADAVWPLAGLTVTVGSDLLPNDDGRCRD